MRSRPGPTQGGARPAPAADRRRCSSGRRPATTGVYRISEDLALVQTVDFFTPIVDDPRDFGRIAAANALSDVYARAPRRTALNLVGFSIEKHGSETLAAILAGGAEIPERPIVGGHSIDDPEPKYGMAVTGVVHPSKVVRNSTGRARDLLFLTKPIGGGAVTTAAKRGMADAAVVRRCTAVMTTLNAKAARAAVAVGASAMTDVTGVRPARPPARAGAGKRGVCASGGGCRARDRGSPRAAEAGALAGGSRRNREWLEPHVKFAEILSKPRRALLCDAMTSGGLLVATPPERAAEMERALADVAPHTHASATCSPAPQAASPSSEKKEFPEPRIPGALADGSGAGGMSPNSDSAGCERLGSASPASEPRPPRPAQASAVTSSTGIRPSTTAIAITPNRSDSVSSPDGGRAGRGSPTRTAARARRHCRPSGKSAVSLARYMPAAPAPRKISSGRAVTAFEAGPEDPDATATAKDLDVRAAAPSAPVPLERPDDRSQVVEAEAAVAPRCRGAAGQHDGDRRVRSAHGQPRHRASSVACGRTAAGAVWQSSALSASGRSFGARLPAGRSTGTR